MDSILISENQIEKCISEIANKLAKTSDTRSFEAIEYINNKLSEATNWINFISDVSKTIIYKVFVENIVSKLEQLSINQKQEESKDGNDLSKINSIFNRKFNLCTMIAEDETILQEIKNESKKILDKVEFIEEVKVHVICLLMLYLLPSNYYINLIHNMKN